MTTLCVTSICSFQNQQINMWWHHSRNKWWILEIRAITWNWQCISLLQYRNNSCGLPIVQDTRSREGGAENDPKEIGNHLCISMQKVLGMLSGPDNIENKYSTWKWHNFCGNATMYVACGNACICILLRVSLASVWSFLEIITLEIMASLTWWHLCGWHFCCPIFLSRFWINSIVSADEWKTVAVAVVAS